MQVRGLNHSHWEKVKKVSSLYIYIYIHTHTSCSIFFFKPFNFFVDEFYLLIIVQFSCTLFLLPKSSNANFYVVN